MRKTEVVMDISEKVMDELDIYSRNRICRMLRLMGWSFAPSLCIGTSLMRKTQAIADISKKVKDNHCSGHILTHLDLYAQHDASEDGTVGNRGSAKDSQPPP